MAGSVYPGALDDFAESSPTYMSDPDATGRTHEGRHNDVEAAIEQVEETLGVNPQGTNATVAEKLAPITTLNGKVGIGTTSPAGILDAGNATGRVIIGEPVGNVHWADTHSFATLDWTTRLNLDPNGLTHMGRNVATHYWDESVGRRLFVWDTINARWQMVYGDTGLRNITDPSLTVDPGGTVRLARYGNTVVVQTDTAPIANTGYWTKIATIPAGFRPVGAVTVWGRERAGATPQALYMAGSDLSVCAPTAGVVCDGILTWRTDEAWPSSLPGAPWSPIPTAGLLPADDTPTDIDPDIPTGLTPDDDTSDWTVTYPDGPTP